MTRLWFALLALLAPGDSQDTKSYADRSDCALLLPPSSWNSGRNRCIRYEDVNEAFTIARQKVGLRHPPRTVTDQTISLLGTALQETTRILSRRFRLSRRETEAALPRLDVSLSEIGPFCARALSASESCQEERYRRHDGTCNNLDRPAWGAASFPFSRLLLPQYADDVSDPRAGRDGFPLPSPRLVSSTVHADTSTRHEHRISFMFPAWGQLIDHDLTLTAETKDPDTRKDIDCCGGGIGRHPNCMPIEIPEDDPFYSDKHQSCMNMARSLAGVRPGCRLGSRTQINMLTSYIDANFMYGSNFRTADSLRVLQSGLMKTLPKFAHLGLKPLLPLKTKQPDDGCIRYSPDIYCFLAGDSRVNEQLALGVLHTLTVREHNRIATELAKINPYWDDETIYQETRHILAALIQHITYNEFLPVLLGERVMEQYGLNLQKEGYSTDYDLNVDATIPAAFGAAAFRFGHSLLPSTIEKRSSTHALIGERKLSEMLQQPFDLYHPGMVDAYTLGMLSQVSQAMDNSITSEVTNHLFEEPTKHFGRDLAAINIARAREHGIPGYMAYRKLCGLDDMKTWDDMWNHLPNTTVKHYLNLYSHPDDVDLWSAGVSELKSPDSIVGPVFSCIIAMTFKRLKIGDRFWYENQGFQNSFTKGQLREIKKYTLSRLFCNTGDNIQTIQRKALLLPHFEDNPRVSCKSQEIPDIDLSLWKDSSNFEDEKLPASLDVFLAPYETYPPPKDPYSPPKDSYTLPKDPYAPPKDPYSPPKESYTLPKDPYVQPTKGSHVTIEEPFHPTIDLYVESSKDPYIDPTKSSHEVVHTTPSKVEFSKPPGFDQVVFNLIYDKRNKSHAILHLTDTYGVANNIDHYPERAVKLE
ncbi:lactoperoxidase-like isoform X2 [Cimex lectularius]|uniref:Chorion peroxidase n=1 Tax=Cimex lectularius TaxID=79782 RepID=A0A8I6TJK5_CIMLE|nr:lactoperoxidase-like isoform X2 [Cimex lectularius]